MCCWYSKEPCYLDVFERLNQMLKIMGNSHKFTLFLLFKSSLTYLSLIDRRDPLIYIWKKDL